MIIGVEIINQPYSGEYNEVIYDIENSNWKSSNWGWIKFINEDYTEWCGEFRGVILGAKLSKRFNTILILTSDCLFMLDRMSGKIIDIDEQSVYNQITISPSDEYILGSPYEIVIIKESIRYPINVELPQGCCSINFVKWQGYQLVIEFEDFIETGDFLIAILDTKTYEITSIMEK